MKKIKNFIRIIVFIFLLFVVICASSVVLRRKDSDYKYSDFFKEAKESHIDVLFLGSSHVINGINPVVLYEDYGITSYNMGGHGSLLQASYWELIESLTVCTPKWVVVDAYMLEKNVQYLDSRAAFDSEDEVNTSIEQLHLNMDKWPLDKLKVAAINDLIEDNDVKNQFLFDFIVYHNRWKNLDRNDYATLTGNADENFLFGGELRYNVDLDVTTYPELTEADLLTEHTVGAEYLMKIIDECQRRGIGVAVTYLPFSAETKDKAAAVKAGEIAATYDVPYINMLELGIVDMQADLNDTGHLNATGAAKVSDYLGKWLMDTGDLADHRNDEEYEHWQNNVSEYKNELKSALLSEENLYNKINLLSMDEFGFVLYVNDDSGIFDDDSMKHLVENISGTDKIENSEGPYILIKDSQSGVSEASGEEILSGVVTALGTLTYQPVEHRFRFLYPAEDESINYLYDDSHIDEDIQLIIYDPESGEIISHEYYNSYGMEYR